MRLRGERTLRIVHTIADMRAAVASWRRDGKRIGFVPTLGGLHEGHGTLFDRSVSQCDVTVVSIFLNALQFGPREDLKKYPRDLTEDAAFCEAHGVDLIFAPSHDEMYPREQRAFVEVEELTSGLCGAVRPGHFRGVTTVVTKLLLIVLPDVAYFGEKDGQQLAVIRRMVEDLNIPVHIEAGPTVREADGLAMSTRNRYLTPDDREAAATVYRGLVVAREQLERGVRDAEVVRQAVRAVYAAEPMLREEYVEVVDAETLQPVRCIERRVMVAVALYLGTTRLIDNIVFPHSS